MTILPVPTPTPLPDTPANEGDVQYKDRVLQFAGTLDLNFKEHFFQPFLDTSDNSKLWPQFLTGPNSGYSGLFGTYCSVPTWQKRNDGSIKAGPFRGFQLWGAGIQDINFLGGFNGPFQTDYYAARDNNANHFQTSDSNINISPNRASCALGVLDLLESVSNSYCSQVYKQFSFTGLDDIAGNAAWKSALNTRPDTSGVAYPSPTEIQSDFSANYGGFVLDSNDMPYFMGKARNWLYWPDGPLGADSAWGTGNQSMIGTYYAASTILGRYAGDGSRFWTPDIIGNGGGVEGIGTLSAWADPNYQTLVNPVTGRYFSNRSMFARERIYYDTLFTGNVFRDIEFLSFTHGQINPLIEPRPGNFAAQQEDVLSFSDPTDQANFGKGNANRNMLRIFMVAGGGIVVYIPTRFSDPISRTAIYIPETLDKYWRINITVPDELQGSFLGSDSYWFSPVNCNIGSSIDGTFFLIDNFRNKLYSNYGDLILKIPDVVVNPLHLAVECRQMSCNEWEG